MSSAAATDVYYLHVRGEEEERRRREEEEKKKREEEEEEEIFEDLNSFRK